MCVQYMKIKSAHRLAPKAAFIPCGKCEECRRAANSQWFFRLRSELEWCRKNAWNIGFFTLTYSDEKVHRFPREMVGRAWLCDENDEPMPMCFSRKDVRTFIDNIRKRLHERYGVTGVRYMICSEYGSDPNFTQRSHYHGLICFPSFVEHIDEDTGEYTRVDVDAREVFRLIHSQWEEHGFVFPRVFEGGRDRHNHEHNPFLLQGDISRAARYASKYVSKDIGFVDLEEKYSIDRKHKDYKNYKPFHIQSKSIGLRWLENKTDAELLALLKDGVSFVGDKYRRSVPLYIRNKILYSPYYVFEKCRHGDWYFDYEKNRWRYKRGLGDHRRLVRKESTQFFERNIREVFARKVEYYKTLFEDMTDSTWWTVKGVPKDRSCSTARLIKEYGAYRLAVGFLTYYGVPYDKCVYTKRPELFYLSRFRPELNLGHKTLINENYYKTLHRCLSAVVDCLKFANPYNLERQAKAKRVGDFYKHLT